ncbi:Gfo/Idh/MocA family protein, partial [Escherichia coli]
SSRYSLVLAGERVNIFDPAMGGGALTDIGVYPVHAMVSLFGVPETVQGAAVTIATGAEGAGVILATYPGMVVDVEYSKITRSGYGSEIQGEDAT